MTVWSASVITLILNILAETQETLRCNNKWNLRGNHGGHLVSIFFLAKWRVEGERACLFSCF